MQPGTVLLVSRHSPALSISDLQQERGLSDERAPEGPPERVHGCRQWTQQQLHFPGRQREAEEAEEGLTRQSRALQTTACDCKHSMSCALTLVTAAVTSPAYCSVIYVGPFSSVQSP